MAQGVGKPRPQGDPHGAVMTPILALDLSLTSTGIAYPDRTLTFAPKTRGMERLAEFDARIRQLVKLHSPEFVVVEGYSYGSPNQAHQIGEMGGVVKLAIHDYGVPLVTVPPAQLKQFATGKGNAKKDDMLEVAIRRYEFEGHGNDEADAWLLLCMAQCAVGDRYATKAQQAVLGKVTWPTSERTTA